MTLRENKARLTSRHKVKRDRDLNVPIFELDCGHKIRNTTLKTVFEYAGGFGSYLANGRKTDRQND